MSSTIGMSAMGMQNVMRKHSFGTSKLTNIRKPSDKSMISGSNFALAPIPAPAPAKSVNSTSSMMMHKKIK